MFGFGKKSKEAVEEEFEDNDDCLTWVRYNCDDDEVEESVQIERHDEEGLEAMEALIDIRNSSDGEWRGFAYVYKKDGVRKEIRPSDEDMDRL